MPKALSFVLILVLEMILLLHSGKAVVYYVSQAGPSDPLCPHTNELCYTLDYYVSNADSYFNSSNSNITMIFLQGHHGFNTANNSLHISHTSSFSMIGARSTAEIIVCFTAHFANVSAVHIENITVNNCPRSIVEANRGPLRMSLLRTEFNQTKFSISDVSTFNIVFEESRFFELASVWFEFTEYIYRNDSNVRLSNCTFDLANFQMTVMNGNVSIEDSSFEATDFSIQSSNTTIALLGNVHFAGNRLTAIAASLSTVNISGNVSFINHAETVIAFYSDSVLNLLSTSSVSFINNTGTKGGALAFYSSTLNLYRYSNATFYNNSAQVVGGAIYVDGDYMFNPIKTPQCFYQLINYNRSNTYVYDMTFLNNTAKKGGEHIYGAYIFSDCSVAYTLDTDGEEKWPLGSYQVAEIFNFSPTVFSSSSSEPTRVCICSPTGRPNCTNISMIFNEISVYPGETFNISAAIVGADFGTTDGTVHANFFPTDHHSEPAFLHPSYQYGQRISDHRKCINLSYTIFSDNPSEMLYLTTTDTTLGIVTKYSQNHDMKNYLIEYIRDFNTIHVINGDLLTTPVFIDVTLLPCPPGFSLVDSGCDCYKVLADNGVKCQFTNGRGYLSWDSTIWFDKLSNGTNQGITFAYYCPMDYCNSSKELSVDLEDDSDTQCAFNRAGTLCGGCRDNYSLAIGSSHCIHCPNNNNLALLIFFAAAGFLLVFFISVFNLTVTQGMINGLIFYANIVWAYQDVLFTRQVETSKFFIFLKTFIAWLNLDFGIQTCFIDGLNTYWKTWLQYIFPFYIWSIVALIIIGARRSTVITNWFGSKAVPILATLFLLSYSKLLRTIIASMQYMPLHYYRNESAVETKLVWFLDGRYAYCHFPHILLFIAALAALLCIWLPYTLQLFLIQFLRRIPSYRLSRLMSRFDPVYDAYFAPLKDRHRYWFGLLLLVRGILLALFTFVHPIAPNLSLYLVQIFAALLLCYANFKSVYKRKSVQIVENMFLINLIIIAGTPLIEKERKIIGVYTSIAITFAVFMGILLWNTYHLLHEQINHKFKSISNVDYNRMHSNVEQESSHSDFEEVSIQATETVHYRDSIFDNESRPISPKIKTVSAKGYKSTSSATTTSYV